MAIGTPGSWRQCLLKGASTEPLVLTYQLLIVESPMILSVQAHLGESL